MLHNCGCKVGVPGAECRALNPSAGNVRSGHGRRDAYASSGKKIADGHAGTTVEGRFLWRVPRFGHEACGVQRAEQTPLRAPIQK